MMMKTRIAKTIKMARVTMKKTQTRQKNRCRSWQTRTMIKMTSIWEKMKALLTQATSNEFNKVHH